MQILHGNEYVTILNTYTKKTYFQNLGIFLPSQAAGMALVDQSPSAF